MYLTDTDVVYLTYIFFEIMLFIIIFVTYNITNILVEAS